jgi:hypothetical protein
VNLIPFGKLLVIAGLVIACLGIILMLSGKFPSWLGHLPGDIQLKGKYGTFYFPIVTCILISIIISVILYIFKGR